jgi:hypothetical protein
MENQTPPPNDPLTGPPLPPSEGALWLKAAVRFLRADTLRWLGITAAFLLTLQIVSILPAVFASAFFLLKPILTIGFLAGVWHQERGQRPDLSHLLFGFRSNWKALMLIGFVYLLGVIASVSLASAVSGFSLEQVAGRAQSSLSPKEMRQVVTLMMWTILFMVPVIFATWFAPALVVFDDLPFTSALARSLHGCLRSIAAIIVYCVVLFGMMTVVSMFIVMSQAISPGLGQIALFVCALPLTAILFIADYVSYRRVFHPQQPLRLP